MIADNQICSPTVTLSEAVDEYLIENMINKKKYYPAYLTVAKRAWKKLFWNTLYIVQSEWMPLRKGSPYNYVQLPAGTVRLLSVGETDHCGLIQPLFYNSQLNVIPKPTTSNCSCGKCDCDGLCEDLNSMIVTTKLVFTINGVNYYEKQWVKYCPNGDILEYTETPVKSYNDVIGDGGDFNNDFNNDYSIGSGALSNFSIVTNVSQRKICALTVQPCGCPENIPENEELVQQHCGCFFNWNSRHRRIHCEQFQKDINSNRRGEIKLSDCGSRIYYKPNPRHHHCKTEEIKLPDYLLVNTQTNGERINESVQVPEYALDALWAGMYHRITRRNNRFGIGEKLEAERMASKEENLLLGFLNPIPMDFLSDVADAEIKL